MIPHGLLTFLVYALAVLAIMSLALIGAYTLAQATGDAQAARVFGWVALTSLFALVVDVVLLVAVLGMNAIMEQHRRRDGEE